MEILPNELLLQITLYLPESALTHRHLHHLTDPVLYDHNIRCNHSSALSWAAQTGRLSTFQKALNARAPLPRKQASTGRFLEQGPPIAQFGRLTERVFQDFRPHPISLATEKGHTELYWVQPLLAAVQTKDPTLVELLLDAGADVNVLYRESGEERTGIVYDRVLFWALEAADEKMVELLLARGANPEMGDMLGCAPLVYAVEGGHEAVVRMLLAYGANPLRAADYVGRELRSLAQTKESIRVRLVEAEARWKGTSR